jgi:N-acetylated-alpha-linked acidic dipeptidase
LQLLRLADSWILPINTTYYSIQLHSYLDKSVFVRFTLLPFPITLFLRVENIAEKSPFGSQVDFHSLRQSLSKLQEASSRLDKEKAHAHWQLKKALWKFRHRRVIRHKLREAYCKVRSWFGKNCHAKHRHEHKHDTTLPALPNLVRGDEHVLFKPRIGRLPGWIQEQREQAGEYHDSHRHSESKPGPGRCHHGLKEVIRAAKRVRDVNKRLSKFEQGFISEDGIKDREWYRHLGVAPGKWLGVCWFRVGFGTSDNLLSGYGATTFPALTESITIEHNVTQAEYEVRRLETLVDGIIKNIGL